MARGPRIRNAQVYQRLAGDLVAHLSSWGRHGSYIEDWLAICGVLIVISPGPVWHLEFVLYPHHRTVVAKLQARVGNLCGHWWRGQTTLRPKPTADRLLNSIGLTADCVSNVESSFLEATGFWATIDNRVQRETRVGTNPTPKTS